MNRSTLLWDISQTINKDRLAFTPFKNIPELQEYLIKKYNYYPKGLGRLNILESVAAILGVPKTKCSVILAQDIESQKRHYKVRSKLTKSEIKRLRKEGLSLRKIGKIADISYERVRMICK